MIEELERLMVAQTTGPFVVLYRLGAWRVVRAEAETFEMCDTGDGSNSEQDARAICALLNAGPVLLRLARTSIAMQQAAEYVEALERTQFPEGEITAAAERSAESYEAWLRALEPFHAPR